jgi:hypothetical protein
LGVLNLVSWNCAGAFRTKFQALARFDADLHIVQECEDPARASHDAYRTWASNYLWVGENRSRGLAVFAREGIRLEMIPLEPGPLQLFLPCRINGSISLLAVWTKQADSPTFQYIGQLWKYLQLHKQAFAAAQWLVVGDLNSNVIWDKWDRWWNHTDVVRELDALGMGSAYHYARGLAQGSELEPTLYLQRNVKKAYHIDYAFLPKAWLKGCTVSVGAPSEWMEHSDHMPLCVAFNVGA